MATTSRQHDRKMPSPTLQFPRDTARQSMPSQPVEQTTENVLNALEDVSRRIDHLARELNCLGYFDDDDDRPRAA